jgi:hypothetical protein
MFYSLSVSWGGLIMFGSYNKFDHKAEDHALPPPPIHALMHKARKVGLLALP